jgi:hypothetical protein
MKFALRFYEGVFWRWLTEPLPAQFLALGLLLTAGRFNAEIPIDRRCVSSIRFSSKLVYAPEQMYGPTSTDFENLSPFLFGSGTLR